MENSIFYSGTICKSLMKYKFCENFGRIALGHIMTILIAVFSCAYQAKTTQFSMFSSCHRTTVARFLNHGKRDSRGLDHTIRAVVVNRIYREAPRAGKPIFCFTDDAVSSKTKPSSQALRPIEDAYFLRSHI